MNRHPPVLSGCRHPARRGATWVLLALCLAGCKSPERQHAEDVDWQVPMYGAPRTQPPPRMTSPIAPGPVADTNLLAAVPPAAATAAPEKSLADAVAAAQGHPVDDGKVYSFTAKDLEIKDALTLFARNNNLNIVPDPDISGQLTVDFRNLTLEKSMEAILDTFNYYADFDGGLIRVRKTKTEFFSVDYLRLNRTGNGNTSATISSSSSSGNTGAGGGFGAGAPGTGNGGTAGSGGDSTSVSISRTDTIKFWDELDEQLKGLLSSNGKLAINRMVGQIMVTDHKANVVRISDYVKHLKRSLYAQVDIEAQIFEVVFNDEFHFGIDWVNVMASLEKWAISSGGVGGIPSSRLIVDNPLGGLQPGRPALSLVISKDQSMVVLDALKEQGRLEVVSQPRVRTLNNQAALIKVGTDKPFFRKTAITITSAGAPAQVSEDVQVQSITIGTVLGLTPQISEDGWITLDISPVITRLVDTRVGPQDTTAPEVDIKQTSSLVRMRENTTIVLGGLIQNEHYKTLRKVPFLGDIPILGIPFRGIYDDKRRTELVIFITPTIVR
jgi:MSHA type pilus biogenesis protein MshL